MPARKYFFTPAIDDAIREAYRQYYGHENCRALVDLWERMGAKLGWPRHVFKNRAIDLGLTQTKEPRWTPAEEAFLARWGHLNLPAIKMRFRSQMKIERSLSAIKCRLTHLRIKQNLDGYTVNQLAHALGEDNHKVVRWINLKMLVAERRGFDGPEGRTDRNRWWIEHSHVRNFIATYPAEIRLACVEKWWFLDLVSEGRISEQSGEVGHLRQKVEALLAAAQVTTRRLAESEEKLRLAGEEVRRLQGDVGRAQKMLRARATDESVREEQRRMDRREINRLRRELARMQGRDERPADEADSEPLNAIALIQAIGGSFQP